MFSSDSTPIASKRLWFNRATPVWRRSAYFCLKWLSQSNDVPIIDDTFNLWKSYPYWQRCAELLDIIHLLFSGAIRSQYSVDFVDGMTTAISEGEMVSSLNLVRS